MIHLWFGCGGHGGIIDGVYQTPGKRSPYIKHLGRAIAENEFNDALVEWEKIEAKNNGIIYIDTAPGARDIPLKQRTDTANRILKEYEAKYGKGNVKAIYISEHFNALDGKFDGPGKDPEGFSVHIQPGNFNRDAGRLAKLIVKYQRQGTPQVVRSVDGIVEQNLHITRETIMPACLVENGFMDNEREANLMLDVNFQKETARERAQAVCEYFGLTYQGSAPVPAKPAPTPAKPTPAPTGNVYTVHVGDTLWGISKKYRVTVDALKKANNLKSDVIYSGDKLVIPGATPAPAPAKQTTPAKQATPVSTPRTLKEGMSGPDVKDMQNRLNKLFFKCGVADGKFGPKTTDALRRFQSVYCNPADGIYGPNTRKVLESKTK